MGKQNFYFSQSMLTKIANVSASTISRLCTKLDIKNLKSEVRKKYDFSQARLILKQSFGKEILINNKVQVFFNFKGGTGKTTICHQISVHMALLGFKVLAIDCDPQAHLTFALGVPEEEEKLTLYDVIVNKLPIKETIKNLYPGLDIIPSDLSLTRIELPLSHSVNREKILNKILSPLRHEYDFIFIDTNPTISILNQNTTYCADMVNIVCETQPFSLKGLEMLIRELKDFSIAMDQLINYKIIPNKYEAKTATSQEVLGSLRHDYKEVVMEAIIRKSEDMNISAKKRLPVCAFCKKNSIAFEDICDLSLAILRESSVKQT
jgi:chromosome partitioning protein